MRDWALGLLFFAFAIIAIIAVIGYHQFDWPAGGHIEEIENPLKQLGAFTAFALVNFTFGRWGALVLPFIAYIWGVKIIFNAGRPILNSLKLLGWGLWLGSIIHLVSKSGGFPLPEYQWGLASGGLAHFLEQFAGFTGAWIILVVAFLLLLRATISFDFFIALYQWLASLTVRYLQWREKSRQREKRAEKWQKAAAVKSPEAVKTPAASLKELLAERKRLKKEEKSRRKEEKRRLKAAAKQPKSAPAVIPTPAIPAIVPASEIPEEYVYPPIDILVPDSESGEISQDELRQSAAALEQRLNEFGVEARVVDIRPGPVITRYDVQPAPGVKVARIVNLQDDLSLSMRARSLRILAPIPGEAAVGIEIPNQKSETVRLRTALDSEAFHNSKSLLSIALGVDTSGAPYVADLQQMPHLLVAGTTGSGKSVCLNSLLASILFRARPDEVRLALIDPKKLELSLYIPLLEHHLITPPGVKEAVITEPENALKLMKSLELEMQLRYTKLSQGNSRNLQEYNSQREVSRLPFIVVVVDELADLMMTAGSAIESPIARLAQMGRAVGIHLIVATQRPSVDVITGVIKANFPCRIAFQVASKVDSRTILDANGAETLLGKGDMLFLPPGLGIPTRIHGSLITTQEIEKIVNHISGQPTVEEPLELPDPLLDEPRVLHLDPADRDELFAEAAKLIAVHQQGSVSLLQRKLKIGYARAARLIDQMEAAGIVGPFDGSKARKVLVTEDWLPEMGAPGDRKMAPSKDEEEEEGEE